MYDEFPAELEKLTGRENDFSDSPYLNSSSVVISLISEAAKNRGMDVKMHRGLVYEVINDNKRVPFRQNSPANSSVFSYCARQKHLTKILLAKRGIPVPPGGVFTTYEDALHYFEHCGSEVAVKPANGAHGSGVSTGISSQKEFNDAWKIAKSISKQVIVEHSIQGHDLRVLVIGGQAVAAYIRVPANVVGDGVSTIKQLVKKKNHHRKMNPHTRKSFLRRFDLLERAGRSLEEVPEVNERVWLRSVSNTSAGGDVVQIFDHVNPEVLRVAEQAARAFPGLPQVGVDLIVDELEGGGDVCVIEVNSNPTIIGAVFPGYGRPINVHESLLDYVFGQSTHISHGQCGLGKNSARRLLPANTCSYTNGILNSSKKINRQVELIKQTASMHSIKVDDISADVFMLSFGGESVIFRQGVPDRTNVISKRMCRDRMWIAEVLKAKGISVLSDSLISTLSYQYRIAVIDNAAVAGLCGGKYSGTKGERCRFNQGLRDITEEIHPGFVEIAVSSVNAVFNPFLAGVDIIAEDIEKDPRRQSWSVNRVVCNPSFSWHHFPDSGLGRDVAATLVRALFPKLEDQSMANRCVYLTIEGKVQGVGFRNWVQRNAVLHGVNGWVRNTSDGKVEMMIEGTPKAIDALLKLCESGPSSAQVSEVSVKECVGSGLQSFEVRR